jgi:hypothetical protein
MHNIYQVDTAEKISSFGDNFPTAKMELVAHQWLYTYKQENTPIGDDCNTFFTYLKYPNLKSILNTEIQINGKPFEKILAPESEFIEANKYLKVEKAVEFNEKLEDYNDYFSIVNIDTVICKREVLLIKEQLKGKVIDKYIMSFFSKTDLMLEGSDLLARVWNNQNILVLTGIPIITVQKD